ncbi:PREDICTED: nesprin-2-like, partial [Buceros rhinoceros silvestris]|uniref:nesprin-2-like n=1 Tax=Buceros rhinoceros silvestris TaxID=175836 RepID=UPI000528D45D
ELENQLTTKSKTLDELKQSLAFDDTADQSLGTLSPRIPELYEMMSSIVSQSFQEELENSEERWAELQTAGNNLKKDCSPSFGEFIDQKYTQAYTKWSSVNEDITDQLRTAQATLQLWEPFEILCTESAIKLTEYQEQSSRLLDARLPEDNVIETLKQRIQDIKNLQDGLRNIEGCCTKISLMADQIKQQLGIDAQTILPYKLYLQRSSYLEKMMQGKLDEFEFKLLQLEDFNNCLETQEAYVKNCTDAFDSLCVEEETEYSKLFLKHTLELAALSPSIESLNEASIRLPLSDFTLKKMQTLTRQWSQRTAAALEQCRMLEETQNDEDKFFQKCENWIQLLEKMQEALKTNIPGRFEELREQQRVYEMLQTEISINQQTFNSIIEKVLPSLESGEAEKRTEFISNLTLMKEYWQNVSRMQRKNGIDGLVSQWQFFKNSLLNLSKFLADTKCFITAVKNQGCYSLYQLRNLIQAFKRKEVILQRWQALYTLIIDVGEKLRAVSDPEMSAVLQEELSQLQQSWGDTQSQMEEMTVQLNSTLQSWDCCEKQTKELESRLQELKEKIKDPLPVEHEELYKVKEHIK